MKKLVLILALAAISVSAMAQDKSNRDANGAVVRGPYETNRAFDNWYIGVAGGVNLFSGDGNVDESWGNRLAPALDAYVGKWFTPSVGARLEYSGLKGLSYASNASAPMASSEMKYGGYKRNFNYLNLHADFMWNISNALGGYRSDRFWSFVPFVGGGLGRVSGEGSTKNNIVADAGLLNLIRLGNRVNLTLEGRLMAANSSFDGIPYSSRHGDYMASVTAGLQVNIGKVGFKRVEKPIAPDYTPYTNKISELEKANKDLADQNAKLANEINALKNRPAPAPKVSYKAAPLSVFFEIGKSEISPKYEANIENIASIIKDSDSNYVIKGYADSATGTAKFNQQLSEKRAEAVKDALVKYGVDASKLSTEGFGGVDNIYKTPLMNRVAIVSAE